MARLEIGYVAGSHPSLDRRMESIRAVVQQTARPYQLVSIPRGHIAPSLPIIIDLSLGSDHVTEVVQHYLSSPVQRPWLLLRMSEYCGVGDNLLLRMPVQVYRNAINTRPAVAAFLKRIPHETFEPITKIAISRTFAHE
ncbi:MAG: hypothetical protein ABIS59_04325 [Candidatus Saccharibacteria bacterium]